VNRELACLKAVDRFAIKNDWLAKNPASQVKFLPEDNEQMRVLTYEEQRRYLAEASQPLQDVGVVMVETGMRPEDVFRARAEDAHPDEGYLYNPYGKTKAARRRVKLNKAVAEVIRARVRTAAGPYLFPSRNDPSQPMRSLQNAHAGALKRRGVRPFRLYDLRHTFASRAAMSEMDLVTLAAILGHSRISAMPTPPRNTKPRQCES
jgi:integrase